MAGRKFVRLWITALVAILVISTGSGAWAHDSCQMTENKGLPAGECVNLFGYDVRVNRGASGLFPDYVGGDSVYEWSIVPIPGTKYNVGHIDIEIPANIDEYANLNSDTHIDVRIDGCDIIYAPNGSANGTWLLYPAGNGDPSISFGSFEFDKYVLKIIPGGEGLCPNITNIGGPHSIKVTFIGKRLFSGLDEFLLKTSPQTTKKGTQSASVAEALQLLGPSLSSQATSSSDQPAVRSGESFTLGTTGCKMHLTLNSDGSIAKAIVLPAGEACGDGTTPLPIEKISKTWICDNDGLGNPSNCKPKKYVEQNIMEEDLGSCTYKYTTRTGQTVTKTITGTADCP